MLRSLLYQLTPAYSTERISTDFCLILFSSTLCITLIGWLIRPIILYLLHTFGFSFFWRGIIKHRVQSFGHSYLMMDFSASGPSYFSSSIGMCFMHGDYSVLNVRIASPISCCNTIAFPSSLFSCVVTTVNRIHPLKTHNFCLSLVSFNLCPLKLVLWQILPLGCANLYVF